MTFEFNPREIIPGESNARWLREMTVEMIDESKVEIPQCMVFVDSLLEGKGVSVDITYENGNQKYFETPTVEGTFKLIKDWIENEVKTAEEARAREEAAKKEAAQKKKNREDKKAKSGK